MHLAHFTRKALRGRWPFVPLAVLAMCGLRGGAGGADTAADEKVLRAHRFATDGPGLLSVFRDATPDEQDREKVTRLIRQLGSKTFVEREKAAAALRAYGPRAVPFLQATVKNADLEVVRRARLCLEKIAARSGPEIYFSALRLVGLRRPEGTAEVLLRYLPFSDNLYVREETLEVLAALPRPGGKPEPAIVKAVSDQQPLCRAAAARALGRAKEASLRAPMRKLLADPDARVRLEAAQALLLAQEKEAVPVLVALLGVAPAELADQAEGLLLQAAGDKAPKAFMGDDSAAARKAWHDAWAAWWRQGGAGLDLKRITAGEKKRGRVLVTQGAGPHIWEFGRDHKETWHLDKDFSLPMDVRALPAGTVLVVNFGGALDGVIELDKAGKILWHKPAASAVAAQRLANGNTFVATQTQLIEMDRAGTAIATHTPGGDILTDGVRLGSGNVAFINTRGVLKEITWPGRQEVRTLKLSDAPAQATDWYRLEPQPGLRLLLASHTDGRVFEIDAGGKVVWEHKVPQAYSATRLPNGNVLIATAEGARLIEVDRSGRVVHEGKSGAIIRRVRAY
jgi:hypothetical protein